MTSFAIATIGRRQPGNEQQDKLAKADAKKCPPREAGIVSGDSRSDIIRSFRLCTRNHRRASWSLKGTHHGHQSKLLVAAVGEQDTVSSQSEPSIFRPDSPVPWEKKASAEGGYETYNSSEYLPASRFRPELEPLGPS